MKRLESVLAPDGTTLPVRVGTARNATATLVLAPGAGSSMKHPAIVRLQDGIAAHGVTVATFDFPYRVRGGGALTPARLSFEEVMRQRFGSATGKVEG